MKTKPSKNLIQYAKINKQKIHEINFKNVINYIELFYSNGDDSETVYNYMFKKNQLCSGTASQLNITDNPSKVIDKHYVLFNKYYYTKIIPYPEMPENKIVYFNNNSNIGIKFNKICISVPANNYFEETTVFAPRTFIFYPNTTVFLLLNKNPFKIYIMYVYSNSVDTEINPLNFSYLNEKLTFDDNWIYTTLYLSCDTPLYVSSDVNGYNTVISDNLGNLYEYVEPSLNKWLYKQYI